VIIEIFDVNEPPICGKVKLTDKLLLENIDMIGEFVGDINCSDGDSGQQKLNYTLDDPAKFFHVNQSGAIIVSGLLDHEWNNNRSDSHHVVLTISDDGSPVKSISVQIGIPISDESEPPQFLGDSLYHACHQ